ncbi:protein TRIGALACTOSYLDIACYLGLYCEROL 3, chloroplastic isoform X2 [Populus alba]|uniref:protein TRIGALACTOSYLDIACYLGLYCEROL 3, chloroplastic isoform X2 n=1 Tax=Populus alba TaxID=43335 RepID=UPI003CC742EB
MSVIYFCFSLLYQITLSCSFLNFDCLCQISQSLVEFRKERKGKESSIYQKFHFRVRSCCFVKIIESINSIYIYIYKKKTQFPFTFSLFLAQNTIWVLFKMLTESLISSGSMLLSTLCIPNGYAPSTGTGLPFNTSPCFRKNLRNFVCACVAPPPPNSIGRDGFAATKFIIRHGEAVGIIGPSGTGKSTILKIIAGLLAPDRGEVYIRGKKRDGLISDEGISGLRIGLVFQSAALFDSLTVRENVGFLLYENSSMSEEQIAELVTETLAQVGLKGVEDRLPSELSGGMKKRVALARSIIFDTTNETIEPEVLLYDEPTAGLDPIASTVVEDLIRSVHMKGEDALGKPEKIASYVVVTHQHSTIRRAVDRLLFLHEGKVVWQGMTDEFMTSASPIVQQFASGSLDGPIKY